MRLLCVCAGEMLFEELSCGLLDKKDQMMRKYQHLLIHDSMVSVIRGSMVGWGVAW